MCVQTKFDVVFLIRSASKRPSASGAPILINPSPSSGPDTVRGIIKNSFPEEALTDSSMIFR